MEASSLMEEGISLMLFGMGFVFVFLTLLVIVTTLMSWVVTKIEKNIGAIPEGGISSPTTFTPRQGLLKDDDENIITVLTAAVHKYRSRK